MSGERAPTAAVGQGPHVAEEGGASGPPPGKQTEAQR